MSREDKLKQLLSETRERIRDLSGDDPDEWFYANRFLFARLALDERKTKTKLKQALFAKNVPCHFCGEPFSSRKNVHLHRKNEKRGYSSANCVLMHPECHRQHHRDNPAKETENTELAISYTIVEGVCTKESKRHTDKNFQYWWDITPTFIKKMTNFEAVRFIKKDNGESCVLTIDELSPFLTEERQSSRKQHSWGIKVLTDRPDELACISSAKMGHTVC